MSKVQPVTDLKRAAPNNVTPASSSQADDFSLCGDGIKIKPLPADLSSREMELSEKPVVEKPIEKPAPAPTPKKPAEKPAAKPTSAKEKEPPKVSEKDEKPVESPIVEEDEEETPEKPKADSAKSSKSGTAKKIDAALVEDVEKKLKDSKPAVEKKVEEKKVEEKKIETVKKELKKDVPVEKTVKTTKLLGAMKKVSFGDSAFCLGFAEKNGNSNFYAKCELQEGKCPTEFNPLTCTLAPIHLSDVLHKAVLTKL